MYGISQGMKIAKQKKMRYNRSITSHFLFFSLFF